jgi:hypothetical protein
VLIPGVNTYPNYLNETGEVYVRFVIDIVPSSAELDAIGENHTFQRKLKPSSKIKDVKKVFNGDNLADTYYGTIYKADQSTPTSNWFRKNFVESKPLLQVMGEETLRLNQKTARVFSGDCYGYVGYFSIVDVNNVTGRFTPTSYNYDSLNNITSMTLKQLFYNELTDVNYELTYDYGKTVKPTIKG